MKTLLQINVDSNANSTGVIASQIGELAISKGWESYIAYSRSLRESKNKNIKIGNSFTYKMHWWFTRFFDCQGLLSIFSTLRFISKIKQIAPNIIHIHVIHDYYINYPLLFRFLKKRDIPVVWTMHDCWAVTGHCAHFDYVGCERWKTTCYSCPQRRSYSPSLIDNSRCNHVLKKKFLTSVPNLTIVSVSNWLSTIFEQSFLSSFDNRKIYNGIDLNIFRISQTFVVEKYNLLNKKILVAVSSTWTEKKGLLDYIELAKILDNNFQVVLIGYIAEKYKKIIPREILTIPRTKDQQELVEWYNAADVVLNLSYEETFGLTTIEGFACGTPSIVGHKTASPELVSEDTGIVVECGNVNQIIKAINIITSKEKSHYQHNCRKRAVELFDKNDRYNDYIDLYEEILKNKA